MTRLLLIILLTLSASCSHVQYAPTPEPTASPSPMPSTSPTPLPSGSPRIGFQCVTCTDAEKVKVAEAQTIANETVDGACFEKFMLGWGLMWTNELTPAQVVADLRAQAITTPVHFYYENNGVVGYRNPPASDIYMNRKFHQYYTAADTASNATHEWSHVAGYDHPSKRTSWRGRTVPYAINSAFDKCAGAALR